MRAKTLCGAVLSVLLLTGCYRSGNHVSLAPLDTDYPVSASYHLRDGDGDEVRKGEYEILKSFSFTRTLTVARHTVGAQELELQGELDRLVEEAGGDGIVDLRVEATEFRSGSHYASAKLKASGWVVGVLGVTGATFFAATDESGNLGKSVAPGLVFAGVGAALWGVGALVDGDTKWKMEISGSVIRRGDAAPKESASEVEEETDETAAPSEEP